jgi:hypothetical protein
MFPSWIYYAWPFIGFVSFLAGVLIGGPNRASSLAERPPVCRRCGVGRTDQCSSCADPYAYGDDDYSDATKDSGVFNPHSRRTCSLTPAR